LWVGLTSFSALIAKCTTCPVSKACLYTAEDNPETDTERCQFAVVAINFTGQEHRYLSKSHPKPTAFGGVSVETTKSSHKMGSLPATQSDQIHEAKNNG